MSTPRLLAGLALAALVSVTVHADDEEVTTADSAEKAAIPAELTFLGAEGLPDSMREKIESELLPMIGKPAPALSLAEGHNGDALTVEDLKGKITIVDIWATWCGPCILAIPHNNELQEKYADRGVQFLGVTTSNGQEKLDAMVEKHSIVYPIAKDPDLETLQAWKAFFFPTYFAVDRDGIVRGVALDPSKIEEVIALLLEEQPAPGEADAALTEAAGD